MIPTIPESTYTDHTNPNKFQFHSPKNTISIQPVPNLFKVKKAKL